MSDNHDKATGGYVSKGITLFAFNVHDSHPLLVEAESNTDEAEVTIINVPFTVRASSPEEYQKVIQRLKELVNDR